MTLHIYQIMAKCRQMYCLITMINPMLNYAKPNDKVHVSACFYSIHKV